MEKKSLSDSVSRFDISENQLSEDPLYADSSVLINNPGSLLDESVKYEDAPQIRIYRGPDPHFFQLISYWKEALLPSWDFYVSSLLVENTSRQVYLHKQVYAVDPTKAATWDMLLPFIKFDSRLVDSCLTFQTFGAVPPASPIDLAIMNNYIAYYKLKYTYINPTYSVFFNLAGDLEDQFNLYQNWVDQTLISPFTSIRVRGQSIQKIISTHKRQHHVDQIKYEYLKPEVLDTVDPIQVDVNVNMDYDLDEEGNVDIIDPVTEDYTSLANFAKVLGFSATQFDNMFVNVPRNCRVSTMLTDWLWREHKELGGKIIVFYVVTPLSQFEIPVIGYSVNTVRLYIIGPLSTYIQYQQVPVASEQEIKSARIILNQHLNKSYSAQSEAIVSEVTRIDMVEEPLQSYIYGAISFEAYMAEVAMKQGQEVLFGWWPK